MNRLTRRKRAVIRQRAWDTRFNVRAHKRYRFACHCLSCRRETWAAIRSIDWHDRTVRRAQLIVTEES